VLPGQRRLCCKETRRCRRQSAVNVSSGFSCLSRWLLMATAAATSHEVHDRWRHQDIDSCAHHNSTRLLQETGKFDGLMNLLQSVQNAAARLVTGLGRLEHITPVLRQLQWLLLPQWLLLRVQFKLATLVHRSLAGTAPAYRSDEITPITATGEPSLRSADTWTCTVRRTHNQFGVCYFAGAGPSLWKDCRSSLGIQTLHLNGSNDS
jgi:hypothetical protein